jgi:hypothetical protein
MTKVITIAVLVGADRNPVAPGSAIELDEDEAARLLALNLVALPARPAPKNEEGGKVAVKSTARK